MCNECGNPIPSGMAPILTGKATAWKIPYLALRILHLMHSEDMNDAQRQFYVRGMCEAFAIMICTGDALPNLDDPVGSEVLVDGELKDVDHHGLDMAFSVVIAMERVSGGRHIVDILMEQVNELGCENDLGEWFEIAETAEIEKIIGSNIDDQIAHLLDTKE